MGVNELYTFENEEDLIDELELVDADGNLSDRNTFFPNKANEGRLFSLEQVYGLWHLFYKRSSYRERLD